MKVITVTGFKGGISKTTCAVHIAHELSKKSSVLLVDEDQNRSAISWSKKGKLDFPVVSADELVKALDNQDFVLRDRQADRRNQDVSDLAAGSDLLVLPCPPDSLAVGPVRDTAKEVPEGVLYRILVTMAPASPSTDGETLYQELVAANIPVFKTIVRATRGYSKAALEGVPIGKVSDSRQRRYGRDYIQLVKEIEEILDV